MKQLLFSVVVPVYNVELYLNRCVESLVNQTYKNLDIVLVDDGSPDNCPELCDEWAKKDERVRVVHKQNAGLGMARNTGIENIHGDFVCFVDSDDYLVSDAVEKCVAYINEYNADTLLFGRYDAYPDGKVIEDSKQVSKKHYEEEQVVGDLLPWLFSCGRGYGVSACSKVFSTDILNKNNIRFRSEREIISEDGFFCIDYFSKAASVLVVPERFYCYYKNGNSLSRTYLEDRQEKNNVFLEESLAHIRALALPVKMEAYVKSKYHVFSLAAMKHITASSLTRKEKKLALRKIYKDKTLIGTITSDVLKIDSRTIAIFMQLIKLRAYCVCNLFLRMKAK